MQVDYLNEELPKTILADIPFQKHKLWDRPNPSDHYSVMSLYEIKRFQFPHNFDSSVLFFWAWNSCMPECLEVIKAWGFTYRTMITWIKPKMGIGNYLRNASEHLIMATKGKYEKPEKARRFTTWFIAERRKHSRKPEYQYDICEILGQPPYLELFSRRHRDGWQCFGNELEKSIKLNVTQKNLFAYAPNLLTVGGKDTQC